MPYSSTTLLVTFTTASAATSLYLDPFLGSLLRNFLGEGAASIVASAVNMPQILTLCGISPEQTDVNFSHRHLDAGDVRLLAFDLSKNSTIRTVKYVSALECLLSCQRPLTLLNTLCLPAVCAETSLVPTAEPLLPRFSRAIQRCSRSSKPLPARTFSHVLAFVSAPIDTPALPPWQLDQ